MTRPLGWMPLSRHRTRAGGIHINGRAPDHGSRFGGCKQSGNGREGGRHGLAEFSEMKIGGT
jgi:aldehyde dehydrogenase (NAD+)